MKANQLGLLPKVLIAIVLGSLAGLYSPVFLVRIFLTLNGLFSQFLNFIIPLIIVGLVVPAIAEIGHRAGKMLLATTLIAYAGTLCSGYLAYGVGASIYIFFLLLQYIVAGALAGKNPLKMLCNMMPAYFTALGTQSSAATIPVTLKQTISNGVSEQIAGFVIPLCATIHLSGSTLKIVSCTIALMIMQGIAFDIMTISGFIFMLGIVMIAAPGVLGGAIMASLGVLSSMLGFSLP